MKVLTATNESQGWRSNDYCCTVEGELVVFPPIECDLATIDDECGCRRGMMGLASHRATSTIKVLDRPELKRATYFDLVADGLREQGYLPDHLRGDPEVERWLEDFVDDLVQVASRFDPGTVLERRGDRLGVRSFGRDPS